jgi:hypothetical protein
MVFKNSIICYNNKKEGDTMIMKELNIKIEKKKADIEKRKNITLKFENKLEKLTNEFERKWIQEDIRTSNNKLKDLEIQLENLYKQKEKVKAKNEVEKIPVIEEFLEQWKIKAIEWYKTDYKHLKEIIRIRREKQKQLEKWRQENNIGYYYNNPIVKTKEKELGLDQKIMQDALTARLLQEKDWETYLEKEIEKEKNNKRVLFVTRVKNITGIVKDASNLCIGDNGEINGIVIGELGKAKVETISAGGYNIQCWHFRVLVHKLK